MLVEAAASALGLMTAVDLDGTADPDSWSCPPPAGSECSATRGEGIGVGWCGGIEDPGRDVGWVTDTGCAADPDANLISAVAGNAGGYVPNSVPPLPPTWEHMK
jgi:hypothetical protein